MYKFSALSTLDLNLLVDNLSKRGCWTDQSSSNKPFNECHFIWRPVNISTIEYYTWDYQTQIRACPSLQSFNHFEKTSGLTSKAALVRNLEAYYRNNLEARTHYYTVFDTMPTTFLIRPGSTDQTFSGLSQKFFDLSNGIFVDEPIPEKHCQSNIWIIKPPNSNQAQGIHLINRWDELKSIISKKVEDDCWVVQKYIERPLLFKDRKFDFRVHVILTSKNEVFLYKKIIVRTSSEEFDHTIENKCIHLTNYSIQVKGGKFGKHEDGNSLTLDDLNSMFRTTFPDRTITYEDHILPRVRDIIIDTVKANKQNLNPKKRKNIFEIFGYDFIIDEDLRTWLLEVNHNPELVPPNIKFQEIFYNMVDDLFEIVLDPIFPPTKAKKKRPNEFELIYCEDFSKFNTGPICKRRAFNESPYPIMDFNPQSLLNTSKSSQAHKKLYKKSSASESELWFGKNDSLDDIVPNSGSMVITGHPSGSNPSIDKSPPHSLQILITGPESNFKRSFSRSNSLVAANDLLQVPQQNFGNFGLSNRSNSTQNLDKSVLTLNMGELNKSYLSIPSNAGGFQVIPSSNRKNVNMNMNFLNLPMDNLKDSLNVSRSLNNSVASGEHSHSGILSSKRSMIPVSVRRSINSSNSSISVKAHGFKQKPVLNGEDTYLPDFSTNVLSKSGKSRSSIRFTESQTPSVFSPENLVKAFRTTPLSKRGSAPNLNFLTVDDAKSRASTPVGKYYLSVERKPSRRSVNRSNSPEGSNNGSRIILDTPQMHFVEALLNDLAFSLKFVTPDTIDAINTQIKTTLMMIARPKVFTLKDIQDSQKIIDLLVKDKNNLIPNSRSNTVVFINLLHSRSIHDQIKLRVLQGLNSMMQTPANKRKIVCTNLIHELAEICLSSCSEDPKYQFDATMVHEALRCLIKIGEVFHIKNYTKHYHREEELLKDFFIRHGGFLTIWTLSMRSNDDRLKKFAKDNFLNHVFQARFWERQLHIIDEQIRAEFDKKQIIFFEPDEEDDEITEKEEKYRKRDKERLKFSMPKVFLSMFSLEDLKKDFETKCKSLKLFHDKFVESYFTIRARESKHDL